jgi:hypothetical protein
MIQLKNQLPLGAQEGDLGLGMCEIKFLEDSPKILREYSYFFIIVP